MKGVVFSCVSDGGEEDEDGGSRRSGRVRRRRRGLPFLRPQKKPQISEGGERCCFVCFRLQDGRKRRGEDVLRFLDTSIHSQGLVFWSRKMSFGLVMAMASVVV